MQIIEFPSKSEWFSILQRPVQSLETIEQRVLPILQKVQDEGDAALREFAFNFDQVSIESIEVSPEEILEALQLIPQELKDAMTVASNNIRLFHEKQLSAPEKIETMPGVICWRKSVGIDKVGLYIPGGTAPLFSTVLMLAIPAKIAGCREIVLCSPPGKDGKIHPSILYAAHISGITKIFKAGGAQAIAAMAYGTESIPKVYKIFGPGNQYVMAAKQLVSKTNVAIDMPAGPSEVAVVADASANPSFVAADLLSQAEHGNDSQVVLLTNNRDVLLNVQSEVEAQVQLLSRQGFASKALENSKLILLHSLDEAMEMMNVYAPEHLILQTSNAEELAQQVINAGSVFIGHFTPESAGDYASGTNHTLPTNGYATAYSGVSVDSFVKKITFQQISPDGLQNIGPVIEIMAEAELLDAHKNAVTLRLNSLKN
jgi:histidinol dehydrogenase